MYASAGVALTFAFASVLPPGVVVRVAILLALGVQRRESRLASAEAALAGDEASAEDVHADEHERDGAEEEDDADGRGDHRGQAFPSGQLPAIAPWTSGRRVVYAVSRAVCRKERRESASGALAK